MTVVYKVFKGKEYLYDAKSAHKVSKSSAELICASLNNAKFMLNDGQSWRVNEVDKYDLAFDYANLQYFKKYKDTIRRYERR